MGSHDDTTKTLCILCGRDAKYEQVYRKDVYDVRCDICGHFRWLGDLEHLLDSKSREEKLLIAGFCREQEIRGNVVSIVTEDMVRTILDSAPRSILDKLDRLLLNLAAMTKYLDERIELSHLDYPIGFNEVSPQLRSQLRNLQDEGLLMLVSDSQDPIVTLSLEGIRKAEQLRERSRLDSDRAFVAMWFDESMDRYWEEGFRPGVEDTGFRVIRIDKREHNEKIDDLIMFEIRRSRFLVADVTGQRQGVYYEAGYAQGLGIPVIWTCKESDRQDVHFDTRQYNHIFWASADSLRRMLKQRILGTIGNGPHFRDSDE